MNKAELKFVTLAVLVFQNTLLVLLLRYTRVFYSDDSTNEEIPVKGRIEIYEELEAQESSNGGGLYLTSTAVFLSEALKFIISLTLVYIQDFKPKTLPIDGVRELSFLNFIKRSLFSKSTLILAALGTLYTIQNNLLFIALSNLEAAVYQVTYQLKILTTAFFAYFLLGKQLNKTQILALVLLTIGVAVVQIATTVDPDSDDKSSGNSFLGLICVLVAALFSGLAGVLMEKQLKKKGSLMVRNLQLASFGTISGFIGVFLKDYESIQRGGFFQGYNKLVWSVIVVQALSGFVIAMVMKYADNILKGFATALSIILSSLLSVYIFDFKLSTNFFAGVGLVLLSVFMYGGSLKQILQLLLSRTESKASLA